MAEMNQVVRVEQREVEFYGDELTAVRAGDDQIYVSLRHMCQALEVDSTGQRQRVQRHKVLGQGLKVCKIQTIQGERDTYVLRVDLVPLWLTGIRTSMVKEEIRPKLEKFQTEAAKVLWDAFRSGQLTGDFDALLQADTPAVQAYKAAMAVVEIARQQVILESKLLDHERRLETIEAQLGDTGRAVTQDQASQISQAVKAVALALSKRSGRNEYGACYGELYRKFGITSYKLLPAARFEEAMNWLSEWYQDLTGETPF